MTDTAVINPETNEAHLIPEEQVPQAVAAGGKRASKVMNPATQQAHYIPDDQLPQAIKAGGQLMGAAPVAPQPQMQTTDLFHNEDPGAVSAVVRAGKGMASVPGAIYHAATDAPRNPEEEKLADTKGMGNVLNPLAHEGGTLISRAALAAKRLVVDPANNAMQHGLDLDKLIETEQDPERKRKLQDVAGGYKLASFVPLVGAPAAAMAERFEYGPDVSDPNSKPDPWGALAEGLTYAITPKIAGEATKLAGSVAKSIPGAVGDAAGAAAKSTAQAVGNVATDAAVGAGKLAAKGAINVGSGVMDALTEHMNNLKSDIADEVQKAIKNPSGNGMHGDIQSIIENSSNGVKHVSENASQIAAELLDRIKSNARTAGDVAQPLIDKAVNSVVDEYYLRTGGARNAVTGKPGGSVSGGAPDNVAQMPEQVPQEVQEAGADAEPYSQKEKWDPTQLADDPFGRGTMNPNNPQAMGPSPQSDMPRGTPAINDQVGVGADKQPLRTPLATLADQEPWAKQLQDSLTRGQNQGGMWQSMETKVRRSPILGRIFEKGSDELFKTRLTQTLRDASQDVSLGANARDILKSSVSDIAKGGRFNLVKTIQQLNDGLNSPGLFKNFSHANPGTLISDSAPRVELLRDGLQQAQRDIEASTRFGEQQPARTVLGTAIAVAQHLGVKWLVRNLFQPGEMDEAHALIRMISNVPQVPELAHKLAANAGVGIKDTLTGVTNYTQTPYYKGLKPSEQRLIDRAAEKTTSRFGRIWKGWSLPSQPPRVIKPGQAPIGVHPEWNIASATPSSHSFSFGQWLKSNPGKNQNDARQAGRDAADAGYEVNA